MGLNLFHEVDGGATIRGDGIDIEITVRNIGVNGKVKTAQVEVDYHPGNRYFDLDGVKDVEISENILVGLTRNRRVKSNLVSLCYSCPMRYRI